MKWRVGRKREGQRDGGQQDRVEITVLTIEQDGSGVGYMDDNSYPPLVNDKWHVLVCSTSSPLVRFALLRSFLMEFQSGVDYIYEVVTGMLLYAYIMYF